MQISDMLCLSQITSMDEENGCKDSAMDEKIYSGIPWISEKSIRVRTKNNSRYEKT